LHDKAGLWALGAGLWPAVRMGAWLPAPGNDQKRGVAAGQSARICYPLSPDHYSSVSSARRARLTVRRPPLTPRFRGGKFLWAGVSDTKTRCRTESPTHKDARSGPNPTP